MLLHELVATTETVGSTSSRLAKIDALGILLARLDSEEIAPAIGFLVAKPRQGRLGVGWRGVAALDAAHRLVPRARRGTTLRAMTVHRVHKRILNLILGRPAGATSAQRRHPRTSVRESCRISLLIFTLVGRRRQEATWRLASSCKRL